MAMFSAVSQQLDAVKLHWGAMAALPLLLAIVPVVYFFPRSPSTARGKTPDALPEWIPGVTNMYQYIFHNMDFIHRAMAALNNRTIMQFRLGPKPVYLVTGVKNVQAALRHSGSLSGDELFYMALRQLDSVAESDINKFKADRTGRSVIPAVPAPEGHDRIWYENHKIFAEYLTRPESVRVISTKFVQLFEGKIAKQRSDTWKSVTLYSWLKTEMAECAIVSLSGSQILDINPEFISAMWNVDKSVFPLMMGVPRLLYSKPYDARDKFLEMGDKFLELAYEKFDWDGPDVEMAWEPIFGSRFGREHSKLLRDRNFQLRSRSGMHCGTIWALNANTIPVTSWALCELIKDPTLFSAVRDEVDIAFETDPLSGMRRVDLKKLMNLPLLQSIYAEVLRLHVSINVTRNVTQDMVLDGYLLKKGYMIQAPSMISHFDENIWGTEEHPASKFWAERHITYVDHVDESGISSRERKFSMDGKAGNLAAYGGGVSICPGRHFAKQEIMAVIAILAANLDIELEEWVQMDGSASDRPPMDDKMYCGTAAMPPDRDFKIRWKAR